MPLFCSPRRSQTDPTFWKSLRRRLPRPSSVPAVLEACWPRLSPRPNLRGRERSRRRDHRQSERGLGGHEAAPGFAAPDPRRRLHRDRRLADEVGDGGRARSPTSRHADHDARGGAGPRDRQGLDDREDCLDALPSVECSFVHGYLPAPATPGKRERFAPRFAGNGNEYRPVPTAGIEPPTFRFSGGRTRVCDQIPS